MRLIDYSDIVTPVIKENRFNMDDVYSLLKNLSEKYNITIMTSKYKASRIYTEIDFLSIVNDKEEDGVINIKILKSRKDKK